jgi:tRNA-dihydrouridine synthase B
MAGLPLKEKSLLFAPMEGVTDGDYRKTIQELYPEWDMLACDFLRISSVGNYPDKHVIKHFGRESYEDPKLRAKTIYQILTSENANTEFAVKQIDRLGFKWLDLNLGCPSKTVCKNRGGSFLLSQLDVLEKIIRQIRDNFPHTFTCKIRIGYEDDSNFEKIIELMNKVGVDAITIHARTRTEMYKGVANWNYVKRAVELSSIPIIGNGDIWSVDDINRYFDEIKCHSIMLARPALKSPWLAQHYKQQKRALKQQEIKNLIMEYFERLYLNTKDQLKDDRTRGKRLKSVSRYIFDDLENGTDIKKRFLLSKTPTEMFDSLSQSFS